MPKVTSKLQVTIPKRIADSYGIAPGDHVEFVPAGNAVLMRLEAAVEAGTPSVEERLRLFDEATARQRHRESSMVRPDAPPAERDWSRADLYTRGKPR